MIPSVITKSSLNDQYGCSSFCTSSFVDGSYAIHILMACLSPHHLGFPAYFFCCHAVWYICTLLHLWLCIYLVISSCLFVLWLCWIANLLQIVVFQIYIGFLCCICECVAIFFAICVTDPLCLSWKLPPAVCHLLPCWLCGWSSNGGIFLGHGVCPGILFLCCYKMFLYWQGSYKCCWLQYGFVRCFIPWELHSTPCLQKTCSQIDTQCICFLV